MFYYYIRSKERERERKKEREREREIQYIQLGRLNVDLIQIYIKYNSPHLDISGVIIRVIFRVIIIITPKSLY